MNYKFPDDFLWGVGSAAFQIEGAMLEDGKTLNVREASFFEKERRVKFADERGPAVCTDFYHRYPEDIKLIGELGDIAWYLAETAHALGVPLDEVLERNIEKLKRRYPEGFDEKRSIHRAKED